MEKVPAHVGDEVARLYLTIDIADLSADDAYYVRCPAEGTFHALGVAIDDAVATADITITPAVRGTTVVGGALTVPLTGGVEGLCVYQVASEQPIVHPGDKITLTVAGGGSGGAPRGHVTIEIDRA